MTFAGHRKIGAIAYLIAVFLSGPARAEDFLQTAETLWFDAGTAPKVSASIELRGMNVADMEALLANQPGLNSSVTHRMVDGKRNGIIVSFSGVDAGQLSKVEAAWAAMSKAGAKSVWSDQPPQVRMKIVPTAADPKAMQAMTANLRNAEHLRQIQDFGGSPRFAYNDRGSAEYDVMLNVQDGSLAKPIRQAMGVYQVSAKSGAVEHDRWVMSTTGVNEEMLPQLRKEFLARREGKKSQPVITRYLLGDPTDIWNEGTRFATLRPSYTGPLGVMRADQQGERPLVLRPGAAVWHSRVHHQNNIVGDVNPALINGDLSALLTSNKYFEALFFEKYLPGAMSRTEHFDKIVKETNLDPQNIDALLAVMAKRFPKGWVMKAVKESNTGTFIITDKLNIKKLVEDYRNSDFEAHYKKVLATSAGQDEDIITEKLQKHPQYLGWKIAQFLKDPRMVIAQERVDIKSEFRVEAIAGRVLGAKSTVDRYAHTWVKTEMQLPHTTPPETIARIEAYVQGLLDKLPPELRGTGFAFDIALLKDGSLTVIESNAGPESGYLIDYHFGVQALDLFLRDFEKLTKEQKVTAKGMDVKRMTEFLDRHLTEWNLDPKIHWPHAEIHRSYDGKRKNAVDIAYDRSTQPPSNYTARPGLPCNFKSMVTPLTASVR